MKVDVLKTYNFVWMWLIKVYKCRRSAIYRLNLEPIADVARFDLKYKKTNLPKQTITEFKR